MKSDPLRYSNVEIAVGIVAWAAFLSLLYLALISWSGDCVSLVIADHEGAQYQRHYESCWNQEGWWNGKFFTDAKLTDVVLAIFTGLLVWVGYVQAGRLRQTIETMDDTAERQLRAYVWARAIELHDLQAGKLPYVMYEVRNAGQTPAYDVQMAAGCLVYPKDLPADTPFPIIRALLPTTSTLHPGAEPPFRGRAQFGQTPLTGLSQDQVSALKKGDEIALWVFVKITYRDAFRKERETHLCVAVDATDALKGQPQYRVEFRQSEQHNSAT